MLQFLALPCWLVSVSAASRRPEPHTSSRSFCKLILYGANDESKSKAERIWKNHGQRLMNSKGIVKDRQLMASNAFNSLGVSKAEAILEESARQRLWSQLQHWTSWKEQYSTGSAYYLSKETFTCRILQNWLKANNQILSWLTCCYSLQLNGLQPGKGLKVVAEIVRSTRHEERRQIQSLRGSIFFYCCKVRKWKVT